jgi:hypothetical protein
MEPVPVTGRSPVDRSILPSQTSDEKFDGFTRKKRVFLHVKKKNFFAGKAELLTVNAL